MSKQKSKTPRKRTRPGARPRPTAVSATLTLERPEGETALENTTENTTPRILPGPPKKASATLLRRFTTHKLRALWFQARASYPVREANVESLVAERRRARSLVPSALNWKLIGPTNIGGRTTALAVHPAQPDTVFIGSAGGDLVDLHRRQ